MFLAGDVFVPRSGAQATTGWELMSELVTRALDLLWRAIDRLDGSTPVPDPTIWIGVATAAVVLALPALRSRPTAGARRFMLIVSSTVGIACLLASFGLARRLAVVPGPAYWVWLSAVMLMCLSPWLRRRDQLDAMALWDRRPHAPTGDLPVLSHLPDAFAGLVRETRAVRVSLDMLVGLDRDARQLLWEWCRRIEGCGPDDTDLLRSLGVGAEPVRAITDGDAAAGQMALLQVDAALARFERALLEYRSYAFR